jgi:hypothetical protein
MTMKTQIIVCLISLLLILNIAQASDHIDGVPSLELHEQVDLTDLYAFKTSGKQGWMTLILNLYPGVSDSGHFSSKVSYDIILENLGRLATPLETSGMGFLKEQAVVNCNFTDPSHHSHSHKNPKVTCTILKNGKSLKTITADVGEIKKTQTASIYTGSRSDAFFITNEQFDTVTGRQGFDKKAFRSGDNLMERINVLSIALELDLNSVFKSSDLEDLYSVSAQSYTSESGVKKILDRVGRPEITNLSLHDFHGDDPVKRSYNQTPLSKVKTSDVYEKFQKRLTSNISAYDLYDGVVNWDRDELTFLTELLLDDALYFSLSDKCVSEGRQYLSIERSVLAGVEVENCGGRLISDDIMNIMYGLYIGGLDVDFTQYETGVSVPYQNSSKKVTEAFPHLAPPEDTGLFTVNIKRTLLNTVLKARQE